MAKWGDQLRWRGWKGVGTGDDKPPQWEAALAKRSGRVVWTVGDVFPSRGQKKPSPQ